MEQETGIGSLYAEFFRGYGAKIGLFCREFRPNSTYKQSYPRSSPGRRIRTSDMHRVSARFRLRTLLIAVALAALVLGLWRRAASLRQRAADHANKAGEYANDALLILHNEGQVSEESVRIDERIVARCIALIGYHRRLSGKYERAIWRPWLSLQRDPPAPPDP